MSSDVCHQWVIFDLNFVSSPYFCLNLCSNIPRWLLLIYYCWMLMKFMKSIFSWIPKMIWLLSLFPQYHYFNIVLIVRLTVAYRLRLESDHYCCFGRCCCWSSLWSWSRWCTLLACGAPRTPCPRRQLPVARNGLPCPSPEVPQSPLDSCLSHLPRNLQERSLISRPFKIFSFSNYIT